MAESNGGFFTTPERITAWAFRTLITLVGTAGTVVLWLAWGSLQEVKTEMHEQLKTSWAAISTLSNSQSQMAITLGVASQTIADLRKEADDHEGRIRTLERPPTTAH